MLGRETINELKIIYKTSIGKKRYFTYLATSVEHIIAKHFQYNVIYVYHIDYFHK